MPRALAVFLRPYSKSLGNWSMLNRRAGDGALSPIGRLIVLQEFSPSVFASVEADYYRINNSRGAIDDVERGMEAVLLFLARGDLHGVFVGHPAGVDAVHVDPV